MTDEQHFGQGQLGFDLGEATSKKDFAPDLGEIRDELGAILKSAREVTADALWDQRTYRYNKVVFPQMSRWLPEEEAQQLCFAFFKELGRIEMLMAA